MERTALTAAGLLAPLLVLASVFLPVLRHYHVPTVPVAAASLEGMRASPADSVLRELGTYSAFPPRRLSRDSLLAVADGILRGSFAYPDFPGAALDLPPRKDQVLGALPELQLKLEALLIPDLLLDAYAATGNEAYFSAARDYVARWAAEEKSAWLPSGFRWNDHAIAGRIFVLARLWGRFRSHPAYREDEAQHLLQAADRGARMLAKPESFTHFSNHGVMQNLALLHAAAAFPALAEARRYRETAMDRLREQFGFYISEGGVVMEHSTGYHEFGLPLVAMALRYTTLLGLEAPPEWRARYLGMLRFYGQIVRPDGTLPMYGDTERKARDSVLAVLAWDGGRPLELRPTAPPRPAQPAFLDPVAGYAVWWRGLERWPARKGMSQLLVAWPDFVSHAHKHADEMSAFLWADGQDWWAGVGYWPYGTANRERAESWEGSNAPHAVGESPYSRRRTAVKSHSCLDGHCLLDLERSTAEGYRARRQVVQVPGAWLVLDAVRDSLARRSRIAWTTMPHLRVEEAGSASFVLRDDADSASLEAAYAFAPGGGLRRLRGSLDPFAGWMAADKQVRETEAFLVELPAEGWALAAWREGPAGREPLHVGMRSWEGPERWAAVIRSGMDSVDIARKPGALRIARTGNAAVDLPLLPPPDPGPALREMEEAYARGAARYPRFSESIYPYRVKVAWMLVALMVLQQAVFFLAGRVSPRATLALRLAAIPAWAALGFWLAAAYFKA